MLQAILALGEACRFAGDGGGVLAVDRHLHAGLGRAAGEFDLQVETCAGQDLGTVERRDRLRAGARAGQYSQCRAKIDRQQSFHPRLPSLRFETAANARGRHLCDGETGC